MKLLWTWFCKDETLARMKPGRERNPGENETPARMKPGSPYDSTNIFPYEEINCQKWISHQKNRQWETLAKWLAVPPPPPPNATAPTLSLVQYWRSPQNIRGRVFVVVGGVRQPTPSSSTHRQSGILPIIINHQQAKVVLTTAYIHCFYTGMHCAKIYVRTQQTQLSCYVLWYVPVRYVPIRFVPVRNDPVRYI